jgi:hypothetical protein
MRSLARAAVAALLAATLHCAEAASTDHHDFGIIGFDDEATHRFEIANLGPHRLEIARIRLTPPLVATRASAAIEPGAQGSIDVRLGTPRERGSFEGLVAVEFRNAGVPDREFRVIATVRPVVDVEPHAAFFVTVARGDHRRSSVDIVNHDTAPLRILGVEQALARSSAQLETIEPGRRYRLWLDVQGTGGTGALAEFIRVRTDHPQHPLLQLQVNTLLRERVYSFPQQIDLGVIEAARVASEPTVADFLGQTLMVYSQGSGDFHLSAHTDVPFLSLHAERSRFRDRYQIEVKLIRERLRPGVTIGHIVLDTNDPQFPRLLVPVRATVQ